MNAGDKTVVDLALNSPFEPGSRELSALERLGATAFDEVFRRLEGGKFDSPQRVQALSLLALLTRHACRDRKVDVIKAALQATRDGVKEVRSRAVKLAVAELYILQNYPSIALANHFEGTKKKNIAKEVATQLANAQKLGLDKEASEVAKRFLRDRNSL